MDAAALTNGRRRGVPLCTAVPLPCLMVAGLASPVKTERRPTLAATPNATPFPQIPAGR